MLLCCQVIAADKASNAKQAALSKSNAKSFVGIVESVTLADPAKEIKSELVAVNDKGTKSSFLVTSTTTIYDSNWKAINLDKIAKDDQVKVRYITTKDGVNEARSINIIAKK